MKILSHPDPRIYAEMGDKSAVTACRGLTFWRHKCSLVSGHHGECVRFYYTKYLPLVEIPKPGLKVTPGFGQI